MGDSSIVRRSKRPRTTKPASPLKPERVRLDSAGHTAMQTTAIHITKDMWRLLRAVAFKRAQDNGGRASVSEVMRELVESHRAELENEVRNN